MKLTDICVSLELAKQLKEAGYSQESLCHWVDTDDDGEFTLHLDDEWDTVSGEWGDGSSISEHKNFAAPTAAKLGEQLPKVISTKDQKFYFSQSHYGFLAIWAINYKNAASNKLLKDSLLGENGETEADLRAECWLYLKQHQLLERER